MRVAREGLPFILVALVLLALLALWHWIAALLWLPIALWTIAFFRDPPRDQIRGEELILAPADGQVVSVIPMDEGTFLGGRSTRVSIFMNVFNVHVNRYPAAGTVALRDYQPGAFLNAMAEKASSENEQASIGLETPHGRMLIRQIAGLVARRIVTDHQVGRQVGQGDRLGLIRFGSRVDLFLPPNTQVAVQTGERTRAGETVVARWT